MRTRLAVAVFALTSGFPSLAQDAPTAIRYDRQGIAMTITPRTPEQITAFYAARGFPDDAVRALSHACLLTVTITHRREDSLWLEPGRWRFTDARGKSVARLDRAYWNALWERMAVPLANRATFGWTQLPESRDLLSGEPVGGNVAIERTAGPLQIEARFRTGADGRGPEVIVKLEGLACVASNGVAP